VDDYQKYCSEDAQEQINMSNSYLDKEERKKKLVKWAVAAGLLLLLGFYQYNEYKEKEALLEYNTKVYKQFLEVKKDFKFLKKHVRAFESSRWNEVVPNVQDMTQVLSDDLEKFDRVLQQAPISIPRENSDD
jgi:hypothetical protein